MHRLGDAGARRGAAVVQGFAPTVGWSDLAEGARAVRSGLPWVATNLDRTVPTRHGPAPGNGALVDAVAAAAGKRPDEVAGKPEPRAFSGAAGRAGSERPLVVGDRLDTDLEGARASGIPGLLVLTGITGRHRAPGRAARAPGPTSWGATWAPCSRITPGRRPAPTAPGGACGRSSASRTAPSSSTKRAGPRGPAAGRVRGGLVAAVRTAGAADPGPVVEAVRRLEPGAAWAR